MCVVLDILIFLGGANSCTWLCVCLCECTCMLAKLCNAWLCACVRVHMYACVTMQNFLSYVPICLILVRGLARDLVLTKPLIRGLVLTKPLTLVLTKPLTLVLTKLWAKPLTKPLTLLRFLSLSSYLSIYLHIHLVPPTFSIHTLKIMTSNQTPEIYKLTKPLPKQMPLYQSG